MVLDAEGSPPPESVNPTSEVVVAYGPGASLQECGYGTYAPFFRLQPRHILRTMSLAPPIKSSLFTFKSTVLAGDFQLTPSMDAADDSDDSSPAIEEERKLSHEIHEQCKRAVSRMDRPLESWAWEMLDACMDREKLAEIVLDEITGGIDAGTYGIEALKVKPHWSYRYRVDKAMNVKAIDCWTVEGLWKPLDPKHFAWYSWEPHGGDPRGDSLGDSLYHAFNMWVQLWPEFIEGNKSWGSPRLFLTTGEHSAKMVTPRDGRGQEIPGAKPVTAEFALAVQGRNSKNGSTIAASHGAQAKVLESARDGVGMNSALALLEAQMIVCIVLNPRVLREAQYGSKADSESGTGVLTTYCQYKRHGLCQVARKPIFAMVEANHGTDVAMRHTPRITLGKIDPRNFAAIAQAIGLLYQAGYFSERQLMWLDGYMGIPMRSPGDVRVGPQKDNAGTKALPAPDPAVAEMFAEIKAELRERGMPK